MPLIQSWKVVKSKNKLLSEAQSQDCIPLHEISISNEVCMCLIWQSDYLCLNVLVVIFFCLVLVKESDRGEVLKKKC